jgi:tetratricopeptide (TPR) repeat protein
MAKDSKKKASDNGADSDASTSSAKPASSSAKPASSSDKPAGSGAKPAGSSAKSGSSGDKPGNAGGAKSGDSGVDREKAMAAARAHLADKGRNDPCHCGSGKKYKKCHLVSDEAASAAPAEAPNPKDIVVKGWGLFEQRRPGAAEKEFRAALALDPSLVDARVGIGMARLSANDVDAAKIELGAVVTAAENDFAKLRADKVTDAFTRPEAQPFIRAAHALGCLAYDQERYADALTDLERVFSIDTGPVGTEARLIAAKAMMKQEKATDAILVLEPATASETGGSRARMGLALAHFVAGAKDKAEASLAAALEANPHFAKTVLGRIRRRVENLAGSQPGSIEEALVYAQTYGDVWTDDAKKFLIGVVDGTSDNPAAKEAKPAPKAPATPPA